jgi:predicted anti-sigma-YlaC factor YlaD
LNRLALCILLTFPLAGCRSIATRVLAGAVSGSSDTYASDDDPELVRAASPFALKTMEALLEEQPGHDRLLTSLSSGFTKYAYAFVQQDADAADLDGRTAEAKALRARARKLYLRARDYGLQGLELRRPGLPARLRSLKQLGAALAAADKDDVPLLYWTAASWALAIASAKDRMDLVAELPAPEAMMTRALALDEAFDDGGIHEFFIAFEAARAEAAGGGLARATAHYERAIALTGGKKLGASVNFAESVCVQKQDRAEFTRLLEQVLNADAEAEPRWRLANVLAQRRARLLLAHADDLFL